MTTESNFNYESIKQDLLNDNYDSFNALSTSEKQQFQAMAENSNEDEELLALLAELMDGISEM